MGLARRPGGFPIERRPARLTGRLDGSHAHHRQSPNAHVFRYICVAGIDPDTGKHIRPTVRGRLSRALLRENGGPFDIAGLVDLGEVIPVGVAPEVEDHFFYHWQARYLDTLTPALLALPPVLRSRDIR